MSFRAAITQRLFVPQSPWPCALSFSHRCLVAPSASAAITWQLLVPQPQSPSSSLSRSRYLAAPSLMLLPGSFPLSCHHPAAPCPSTVIAWWLLFPQLPPPKLINNPSCLNRDRGHGGTGLLFQRVCWKPGYSDCKSVLKHHVKIFHGA